MHGGISFFCFFLLRMSPPAYPSKSYSVRVRYFFLKEKETSDIRNEDKESERSPEFPKGKRKLSKWRRQQRSGNKVNVRPNPRRQVVR